MTGVAILIYIVVLAFHAVWKQRQQFIEDNLLLPDNDPADTDLVVVSFGQNKTIRMTVGQRDFYGIELMTREERRKFYADIVKLGSRGIVKKL